MLYYRYVKQKIKIIQSVFVQQFCLVTEDESLFLWPKDTIIGLISSHVILFNIFKHRVPLRTTLQIFQVQWIFNNNFNPNKYYLSTCAKINYGINCFVRTCMWRAFLLQTNVLFFQRELYGPPRATLQEGCSMLPLQQTLPSEEIVHELLSVSRSVGQLSRAQQHMAWLAVPQSFSRGS